MFDKAAEERKKKHEKARGGPGRTKTAPPTSPLPGCSQRPRLRSSFGGDEARCPAVRCACRRPLQEREKARDKKEENRRLYHLRHSRDYEVMGVPLGAKKDVIKAAYRKLAVKWHPDKHPEGPAREEAQKKFVKIQRAYDSLMTTDEEATVEALTAK